MKLRIIFVVLSMLVLSSYGYAQEKTVKVTKISEGVYEIVMDGVLLRAYTAEELRKKEIAISELKSHIDSLEKLRETQKTMIAKQKEQLDRMTAQIEDYRTMTTKLEKMLELKPSFSFTAGLGYLNSEALGMAGVGYGNWRLMGLLQPSSAGVLLSKDF